MAEPSFSLCVYLGSRPGENPLFTESAIAVGEWIGRHGGQLVYGGGRSGLMGTVAEATRRAGGRVLGVIPRALVDKELANRDCDELHIVETMHERKAMMAERCNAFLALPGGIGTFEELFEVWTWRQLGYHDKPIGLLNVDGYYDGLMAFLQTSVASGLMSDWQMGLMTASSDRESLLQSLVEAAGTQAAQPVPLRTVI
ncbi:TIGR00730 family Rossman fold protein [Acidovorax sp. SUPP2522]|uniref:LOG family protein n=1 Tax=unclassified Acidovorax TaxID=2684926 RepID=UPI00234B7FC4|nr:MULTISPECIES: TIGR00730 family Rossman fold protein [unclassified Acidovorax]WCN00182.1 TIGR00730 family Rossman fold protein [Acidovorax sp. GBBC 1281]GKS91147.1 TIGR00730 family Rossman fold protein [Acidovorax sp. SUPP2539]GKT17050.1 TIGR00730 family Rossman fold protein [Acidovorax sp. SUPP2522]